MASIDLRAAAQQALEALEGGADSWQRVGPAIDALKAALAEPVQDDGDEKIVAELRRLHAQRDALLEALKAAVVRAELRREGAVDVEVIRAAIRARKEKQ